MTISPTRLAADLDRVHVRISLEVGIAATIRFQRGFTEHGH